MKRTEFSSACLHERYTCMQHASGLPIYVFPKKLTTAYAFLATRYGSIDTCFCTEPNGTPVFTPDGVAHFLEHKLFENEDGGDAFEHFAALGADANAYTSYNRTAYLFSCTENFEEALAELLHFVTHPHFTEQSVKKEQGIIAQEIRECEDNPWECGYQLMLEALYESHPVRKNICGTVASIAQITPQLLYDCHRLFYHPANMALVICGDVTPDTVLRTVNRVLPSRIPKAPFFRAVPKEPPHVASPMLCVHMPVSKPIFCIGIKDPSVPSDPQARLRRDTAFSLLDEILFSRAGRFYNELFESGTVTPSFAGGYSSAEGFGFHCISGESDTPELVLQKLKAYLMRVCEEGIEQDAFERCRRVLYSDELRAYDSTEEIASRLLSFVFDDVEMFSYLSVLQSITKEELESLAKEAFREELFSLSVVRPLEK